MDLGRFTPSKGANRQQAVGKELLLEGEYLRDHPKGIAPQYRDDFVILPGVFRLPTSDVDQRVRGLFAGRLPGRTYGQHRCDQRCLQPVPGKEAMVRKWNKRRAPVFRKNLEFNLAMLERLLERAEQRGVDVVLLEMPRNEAIIDGRFDWARAMYAPGGQELAERYGVTYLDCSQDLGLGNEDSHDLSHLVEPGRELWEQRLAEELAAFYERQGTAGSDSADEAEDTP